MQSSQQFDSYVARLERVARERPGEYRLRALLFGFLGYAYVFGVLALLLALVVGLGWWVAEHGGWVLLFKVAIPVLMLGAVVLKAMWVRIDPPAGTPLARADAPRLFAEVDAVRRAVDAPPAHRLLLTDDFNASVSQVPRLGMFGWHRNYLALGVPLLHALSPAEFRAVLAHEFGHLSRAHGRTGAWIYRIRSTWVRILEQLEQEQHPGTFIFERFFRWYAPRFAAYSFVLARRQEFEADERAAAMVGRETMAAALMRVEVRGAYLGGSFWPGVWGRARMEPEPPADAFSTLARTLGEPMPAKEAEVLLAEALAAQTRSGDTHPVLAERLAALGVRPTPALLTSGDGGPSAAEELLGGRRAAVLAQLDHSWSAAVRQFWSREHEQSRQGLERLAELERQAAAGPLSPEEARERAWAVANLRGGDEAVPLFQEIARAAPEDGPARYMLGQLLLERGDPDGLDHLEAAMATDPGLVQPACGSAHAFLLRAGRTEEAERYWRRLQEHQDLVAGAQEERSVAALRPKDVFLPHGLGEEALQALVEALRRHRDVERAYLVRKQVKLLPDYPLHVLAVVLDLSWMKHQAGNPAAELVDRLGSEVAFPGDGIVLVLDGGYRKLRKPIGSVPGAEVYVRGRTPAPRRERELVS
ncbi:MAG TPA: M48 family metalloprotease [Longimicrobiaceae bacterium]|nr:M48 family metalloprotease [Longimicrobiaceae bacterium]